VELDRLVERVQAGELEAFGEIVRRFQDMACGYAYAILGDFHLAQDAAQEAFVQAYRDLRMLRKAIAFPGWLRRIVFKQCDRIRRTRPAAESLDAVRTEPVSGESSPPEAAERRELRENVLAAVRSLSEHQRTVTTLFYIDGYTVDDIADFLETPAGTVKRRLHDSRKELKERMVAMVSDYLHDQASEQAELDVLARITIDAFRTLYREPDILAHFANPDRNADNPDLCAVELALARRYGGDSRHVLVIGCAGGQDSFAFAEAGYTVTGLDIVPEFIEAARHHAETKGCEDRARFELVDGFQWPVGDGSCGFVCMSSGFLYHLPAGVIRRAVFSECRRALFAGGAVMMDGPDRTHPVTQAEMESVSKLPEYRQKKAEWHLSNEVGAAVNRDHPCSRREARTAHPQYYGDPREVWAELADAGLRVVQVESEENPNGDPSVGDACFRIVAKKWP
jgi:RNA polymerase sigma factor (sigma-70 family)